MGARLGNQIVLAARRAVHAEETSREDATLETHYDDVKAQWEDRFEKHTGIGAASSTTWCYAHGGGVGIGFSQHACMAIVADGSDD